jgi:hypothetical protein
MPIDNLVNHGRLKRTCFFNPGLMRRDSEWDDPAGGDETQAHVNLSERTWLFVLSSDDVSVQQYQWGRAKFAHQMVHLLEQTRAARRRPVLVGPPSFIKNVRRALPSSLECELVQFCSYREFASRLVSAEYAFYWNALSCSAALVRLVRRLPVFFFARGHVAQISKEIYADGLRCYYGGWEPTQLERGELDPDVLAVLAADQRRAVDALLEYWGHAPTPRQLIDGLLQDSIVQPSAG